MSTRTSANIPKALNSSPSGSVWRREIVRPTVSLIVRQRLLARIAERFDRRLTVVRGGPGFGKSTLLWQAIEENRLALRGEDRFWRCTANDASADGLIAALGFMNQLDLPDDSAAAVSTLATDIWAQAPRQIVLVFDDAHLLWPENQPHALLAQLLDELPLNGHLLFATRTAPPVPMVRLAASNALSAIDEEDLCFTEGELSEFGELRGAVVTGADRVWPALAELSVIGGRGRVEFVWEQVLNDCSEKTRQALQALSVLNGGDNELVAAVIGEAIDLEVALAHIPLVNRDAGDTWTAHRLWADHVSNSLSRPDLVRGVERAGDLLSHRGEHSRAVRLLSEHGSTAAMLSAMRSACLGHEPAVSYPELQKWIDLLPLEARDTPVAVLVRAIFAGSRDFGSAPQLMAEAVTAFELSGDAIGELLAINKLVIMTYEKGDIDQVLKLAPRVQALAQADVRGARELLRLGEGMFFLAVGDDVSALDRFGNCLPGELPPASEVASMFQALSAAITLGRESDALAFAQRALDVAPSNSEELALSAMATAAWMSGDASRSESIINTLLTRGTRVMVAAHERSLLCYLASLAAFGGRSVFAESCLSQTHGSEGKGVWRGDDAEIGARAMLAISMNHEDSAADILRTVLEQRGLDSVEGKQLFCKWPALSYVLLPETRTWWHERSESLSEVLGRRHTLSMQAASAVVRSRSGGGLHAGDAVLATELLRTVIPVRWGVEVAVALAVAGQTGAASTIVALYGPPSRDWLEAIDGESDTTSAEAARSLAGEVLVSPSQNISLSVIGPLSLSIGGRSTVPPDDRSPELLAFLATRLTATRGDAGAALWPALDSETRERLLELTLESLHQWLEPERRSGQIPWFVRCNDNLLALVTGPELEVDFQKLQTHLDDAAESFANHAPSKALEQLLAAIELSSIELLPQFSGSSWATATIRGLKDQIANAATRAGELLVALGKCDEAASLSATAVAHDSTLQSAWRLRIDALRAMGAIDEARDVAALFLRTLREANKEPDSTTVEAVRNVTSLGRTGHSTRRSTYGWESLTRTEEDVVTLLLGGRTNRRIGVELGISPRTVETHLAHVYDKLGIRTRVELAAEAARRGPQT